MKKERFRTFARGHFPAGTVVEYSIFPHKKPPMTATVQRVVCNGPRSWVAECGEDQSGFNIEHVKRIIKRGGGPLIVISSLLPHTGEYFAMFGDNYRDLVATHGKSKNEYLTDDIRRFVHEIVASDVRYRHLGEDHMIDLRTITTALLKSPAVRAFDCTPPGYCAEYRRTAWRMNKVKFHRVLKQLLAKHKLNRRAEQRAYNDAMDAHYEQELDRDLAEAYGHLKDDEAA